MKNWLWIPLAALVGLVAGSWGPREDLRLYKEKAQEAKNVRKASDASGFGAFAKMVNIPDVAKRRPRPKPSAEHKPAPAEAVKPAVETNGVAEADRTRPHRHPHHPPLDDLRLRIDEATELWRTRVELAKTQWTGRLGISGEAERAAFDSAFEQMNERLLETMTALAAEIERAGKLTPELSLRLMGDASAAMAGAYDALRETVPEGKQAAISEMPVFEFIDPAVAEPLVSVQDKLDVGLREMRR